jgi:hypothetical protein
MGKRNYSEASAIERLRYNGISISDKVVNVQGLVGIKLWGCIEYLCHKHGYTWQIVTR